MTSILEPNNALSQEPPSRQALLERREQARKESAALLTEARRYPPSSPEVGHLLQESQSRQFTCEYLDGLLKSEYLPAHGAKQLISPRVFFLSPLFRVAAKACGREDQVTLDMRSSTGDVLMRYTGPELRQSDGLVFMALLNLTKDQKVGAGVSFSPEELCRKLFHRYDGPLRAALRAHIRRLQRGLLELDSFSVQLCQRFDHPKRGLWRVALDPDVVALFQRSTEVWLNLNQWQKLPEGLATWLYAFVESQTRLIPTPVATLRGMCGSAATPDSFLRTLRQALNALAIAQVIDPGWKVQDGTVRWMKARQPAAEV